VQAVLGVAVDVTTLTGQVEMKVPKGCQPDKKLMLREKGAERLHGASKETDFPSQDSIQFPKEITKKQDCESTMKNDNALVMRDYPKLNVKNTDDYRLCEKLSSAFFRSKVRSF
jgi:DnaJ-class molecular chaperone